MSMLIDFFTFPAPSQRSSVKWIDGGISVAGTVKNFFSQRTWKKESFDSEKCWQKSILYLGGNIWK